MQKLSRYSNMNMTTGNEGFRSGNIGARDNTYLMTTDISKYSTINDSESFLQC
jgi:hypothetical protein